MNAGACHAVTLVNEPGGVEEGHRMPARNTPWIVMRVLVTGAFALSMLAFGPGTARAEPAFGDSNWVAPASGPTPDSNAEKPADPGARVAKPDHEPAGESILRLPFRVLFFPLRLIARGLELGAGLVGARVGAPSGHTAPPHWSFEPTADTSPGAGIRVTRTLDPRGDAKVFASGMYALDDGRKANLTYRSNQDDAPHGLRLAALYNLKPNRKFYGVGNSTSLADKSIWLQEETRVVALYHLGMPVRHELRVYGSYSQVSARSGFNGPPGVPSAEEVFTPEQVPFLQRGSHVYSFGAAADLGHLDELRTPRRGVAARLSAEQFKAADSSELDYRRFHAEARAYVPVFADRRVLALRALHDWVDQAAGSPDPPYYRLPETNDDLRFNGYVTHRFTDKHLVMAEAEYRWLLSNKLFALINASAGEVASSSQQLRLDQRHQAFGLGLRYGYSDRFCARMDVAKGSEGVAFYLNLEDSF
jgi:hypothetical protein